MPTDLCCQTHVHGFEINYSGDLRHAEVLFELEVLHRCDCKAKPTDKPTGLTGAIAWAKAERSRINNPTPKKPKSKPKTEAT